MFGLCQSYIPTYKYLSFIISTLQQAVQTEIKMYAQIHMYIYTMCHTGISKKIKIRQDSTNMQFLFCFFPTGMTLHCVSRFP